ncbi:MAG: ABC-F family ATP-binding cassette domain-containing protein [Clostridia bacterium]|nr:ABC-F family ATP-binding cassette domain-containing protein [Clostridia bacterium]
MILLSAEHIKKSYTEKRLLDDINITINSGDKIGLIGVNGSGKSTLLKIIAGVVEEEGGTIITSNQLMRAYLPQNPPFDGEMTIMEQAMEYAQMQHLPCEEYECQSMLTKLGLFDFSAKMKTLSGGQRKKVAIAAVLACESNLLILDEPTNHMDSEIIIFLEDYLTRYKGAVFMITHDRYFLDRICNVIVEIDNGILYSYEGNYDYYLTTKASRKEMELASERKRLSIYKKELAWIRRGAQARTTKAKGRIQRFHDLEDSKLEIDDSTIEMTSVSSRLGRKIIEINNISKSYGERQLIKDFEYVLLRNDRVGIVGPNGCGKTTLLNMIMGNIEADEGWIDRGETVKIGYFSQHNEGLDEDARLIKFVSDIATNIKTTDGYISASQMLERFLFPPHMHSVLVKHLSGGEKRRLYLLSVLMKAPNVLILDEPTNDLDINTLTILEDYLDDFEGALIVVSHDRYFLDRTTRRTFAFEEGGRIGNYNGSYSDYKAKKDEEVEIAKQEAKEKKKAEAEARGLDNLGNSRDPNRQVAAKPKFTYKEQKEYETIDDEIAELEERLAEIDKEMGKCGSDYGKLNELQKEKDAKEEELTEKMGRWEYLSEIAEAIANYKK